MRIDFLLFAWNFFITVESIFIYVHVIFVGVNYPLQIAHVLCTVFNTQNIQKKSKVGVWLEYSIMVKSSKCLLFRLRVVPTYEMGSSGLSSSRPLVWTRQTHVSRIDLTPGQEVSITVNRWVGNRDQSMSCLILKLSLNGLGSRRRESVSIQKSDLHMSGTSFSYSFMRVSFT